MSRTPRPLLLLVAAMLALAGCGEGDTTTDTGATSAPTPAETTSSTAAETEVTEAAPTGSGETEASATGATITVVDPGAEPRQELRYRLVDGTSTMQMTQEQTISQTIDGQAGTPVTVSIDMTMENTVAVLDGQVTVTQIVTAAGPGPDADPATAAQLEAGLVDLVGLTVVSTLDERGNTIAYEIVGGESLPTQVRSTMDSLAGNFVPLPTEPVGVGATLRTVQQLTLNGVEVTQTTDLVIDAIDGDRVHFTGTGSQMVPAGPIALEGMPAGTSVEVVTWDTALAVDNWIDLTSPVVEMNNSTSSTQALLATQGGLSVPIDQVVEAVVTTSAG